MRIFSSLISLGVASKVRPEDELPSFKIDLSLPPQERFTEVALHFKDHANDMRAYIEDKLGFFGMFVLKTIWSLDFLIPTLQPEKYHEI